MVRSLRSVGIAIALVAAPAMAQVTGSDGEAFIAAMKDGESNKAVDLLEKPGSTVVNYRTSEGNGAIHIAMRNRDGNWVGFLLAHDADPDLGDKNGDTGLILAARMLMNHAQVDKTNKLGETALIVAVQQRQPAIVKMLLENGADPDKQDHASGYSAREYAKRDTRSHEILNLIETVKSKRSVAIGPARP
jgi:ankyrin repeat protein